MYCKSHERGCDVIKKIAIIFAVWFYPYTVKWIPLLPVDQRVDGPSFFSIKKICSMLWDIRRDAEYLSYKHAFFAIKAMLVLFALVLLDAFLKTNIFVDPVKFVHQPSIIATAFRNISFLPWVLITVIFYVRIRFSLDMPRDRIPFLVHPARLDNAKKADLFMPAALGAYLLFFLPFAGHCFVFAAERYFGATFDLLNALFFTGVYAAVMGGVSWATVAVYLTLEKVNCYFDDLKEHHIPQMIAERDARTDKYTRKK